MSQFCWGNRWGEEVLIVLPCPVSCCIILVFSRKQTDMPSLFFCAQHFLLTYAHVEGRDGKPPLDPFRVVEVIGDLGAECIVARELYPTGEGFHFHVFVSFERRFRSRKADVFDVDGYHPNVEPSRKNALGGFDYATKDGEVVAGGLERPSGIGGRRGANRDEVVWGQITTAETRDEFWSLCDELDPKSLVCNFPALQRFADWKFRPVKVPYVTPDGVFDTSGYDALDDWRDNVLYGGSRVLERHWTTLRLTTRCWMTLREESSSSRGTRIGWGVKCNFN
uniref:Replication-associated protein n=1 Tax=Periparus ater Genomoviridae sp. TaxID=2814985 RepID=A0A8E7G2B4_9VIRU